MARQTFRASKEGQKKIQTAIATKKWKISEQDTRPLVAACLKYIEQYQTSHNLDNNARDWLQYFEHIFRVGGYKNQPKEEKKAKLAQIKTEIIKTSGCTLLDKIKERIESGELSVPGISYGTWSSFSRGKPIESQNIFQAYCAILDLDGQEIQENPEVEDSPPSKYFEFSLKSNLDEVSHQCIFYGRKDELNQLLGCLNNEQIRVILLSGLPGIGKTTLIVKLLESIKDKFDCIVYKDLSNPQPFSRFYRDLNENHIDYTGDINPIIDYLSNYRCLLILDNWEELLHPEELAGCYDHEYQQYGDLLSQLAQTSHQSCVLVISQEKPKEFEIMSIQKSPIYLLELSSLNEEAAIQIFEDQGFAKDSQYLSKLINLYSCHPGILSLVAQDIKQEFNGNILQYLSQSSLIISDVIGNYVVQTFNKLSAKEIEIIYLLSMVTESLSQQQLKTIFDPYLSGTDILDAIKSLKRRSLLIQDNNTQYNLERFIKKYVSNLFIDKICEELKLVLETGKLQNTKLLRIYPLVDPNSTKNLINPKVTKQILKKISYSQFSQDLDSQLENLLSISDETSLLSLGYFKSNLRYLFKVKNEV